MFSVVPRRVLILITAFAALLSGMVLWDFYRFAQVCRSYGHDAVSPTLPADVSNAEAIVVLTGDKRRIPKGLELLRQRGTPWLIISGTGKNAKLVDVVNNQGDAAKNIHQHWNKIVTESRSQSTVENAYESGKIIEAKQVKRVILVTSDYHMPRALRIFRLVLPGTEVIPYPVLSDFSPTDEIEKRPLTGLWFVWIEYWKSRIFEWYGVKSLIPLRKN